MIYRKGLLDGTSHQRGNDLANDQLLFIITQCDKQSRCSSVEVKFCVSLLDNLLVGLLEVFRQNYVSVLSNGLHASLLGDGLDVCGADFLWPRDEVLQVDLLAQVHFTR